MIETTCRRPWGSARRPPRDRSGSRRDGRLGRRVTSAQSHWEHPRARVPSHSSSRGRRSACRGTGGRRRRTAAPGSRAATTRDRSPRTGAAQKAGRHLLASPDRSRPSAGGVETDRRSRSRARACARPPQPVHERARTSSSRLLRLPRSRRRIRATRVEPPGPGSTRIGQDEAIAIAVAATASAPARTRADSLRALVGLVRWTSRVCTDWAGMRR